MPSDFLRNAVPITHALTATDNTAPASAVQIPTSFNGGRLLAAEVQRALSAGGLASLRVRGYRSSTISQLGLIFDFTLNATSTPALPADAAGAVWPFDDFRYFEGSNLYLTAVTGGAGQTITGQLLLWVEPNQKAVSAPRAGTALT